MTGGSIERVAAADAVAVEAGSAWARAVPHSPQNRVPGALAVPHDGQVSAKRVPHWPQNLRPGSFAAPQTGHTTSLDDPPVAFRRVRTA